MKIGHKDFGQKDIGHRDIESAKTEPVERPDNPADPEPVTVTEPRETLEPGARPAASEPMDAPTAGEPVPAGQSVESETTASKNAASKNAAVQEDSGLFSDHEADGYRTDWRSVQAAFVDDPQAAVGQAEALVGRIVDQVGGRISERRAALSAMRTDTTGERTEQLRQTLRGYRALLEQLLPREASTADSGGRHRPAARPVSVDGTGTDRY